MAGGYAAEPEPTRFGVINGFTRAAQKLGPLQRIEMERFAGTLLEAKLWSSFFQGKPIACLFSPLGSGAGTNGKTGRASGANHSSRRFSMRLVTGNQPALVFLLHSTSLKSSSSFSSSGMSSRIRSTVLFVPRNNFIESFGSFSI
jgi:hypothetical protein